MPAEIIEDNENLSGSKKPNAAADSREEEWAIFVFVWHYLPGFKGGGPIRSIANLVEALGKEFRFKVVTSDRDLGDKLPYPDIATNRWIQVGNADVMYLSPGLRGFFRLMAQFRSRDRKAVLYLNSFFSRRFSMLPILLRWLGLIDPSRVIIAPRGEFSSGALNLKRIRKSWYLRISRWLGTYRDIIWHASSEFEAAEIRLLIEERRALRIAEPIPSSVQESSWAKPLDIAVAEDIAKPQSPPEASRTTKHVGRLRIVFASRLSPKKNLIGALGMLREITGEVVFSIYGPAEDTRYWGECLNVIATLPDNIRVEYRGMVTHDKIEQVFAENDLFLFPTLGENYGHVICEALMAGCPVLISDQTPWRNLEENNAGWDIPLSETARFCTIIQQCVDSDDTWRNAFSAGAKTFAMRRIASPRIVEASRRLFADAIRRHPLAK